MRVSAVLLVVAAALVPVLAPTSARSSVLISELCDPLNNYQKDRFIEIANTGTDAVDLTGWSLIAISNSNTTPVYFTWPLSGTITPGQALVAGNQTTVTVFPVTFAVGNNWEANNATWNGQIGDGAKLVGPGGATVDYVVVPGTVFKDADYVRKPSVFAPSTTYNAAEWTATAVTLATDASPGIHTLNPRPPGPRIAQVLTDPALPLAGAGVNVLADVTDSTATITSVSLFWGTTPSSLPNQVAMPLLSGITYHTNSPIPAQVAGTTVYYKIQASDNVPVTNDSDVRSYTLDYDLTIHQIQGETGTSPYNGAGVITRGVVTASYAAYFVVQDGSGPWNGLWVRSTAAPSVGDSVKVRGQVSENDVQGLAGNTLLTSGQVLAGFTATVPPVPAVVSTAVASSEAYEGVLVKVASAACTNVALGQGQWQVNDGSGTSRVDVLGYAFTPTLGTSYDVTGPVTYSGGAFMIEPRDAADVVWAADHAAPVIIAVAEESDSTLRVTFSEPVEPVSAATAGHYTVAGLGATAAAFDAGHPDQALVTVPGVPAGPVTLVVTGVADLYANATAGATWTFQFVDTRIPAGYYDSAIGLRGEPLKAALHDIIKNHTVKSYDYAFTAFQTTDVKPNGKVWDVYSDVPGGTPPYEYTFGQTGGGSAEGSGYNREHSWPKTWFGGTVEPMYSDLWILYPTDTKVNNYRGDLPYGDVASATITSLNGSQVGPCADAGYTATVFEPIDAYKGDLARSYFYVSTRYYSEDAAWPGGPATSGAELLPWANSTYLAWHAQDPASQKERLRNGAIYVIQHNRNPFVDHPEFAALVFDTSTATAVGDGPSPAFRLHQNTPNPFSPRTAIRFDLARRSRVDLRVYDVSGRLVRTLLGGDLMDAGRHEAIWDGQSESGGVMRAGLYFYRVAAGSFTETRRMVLVR